MNHFLQQDKRLPPRLFEFDIASGSVRQRPLPADQIGPGTNAAVFDANNVLTGRYLIERSTGRMTETPHLRCIGMREGQVYSLSEATDAIEVTRAPVGNLADVSVLYRFTEESGRRVLSKWLKGGGSTNGVVLFGKNEVYVWDGKRWVETEDRKR
jgi:hypothetical protein